MKFTATLAVIALGAQALNLSTDAQAEQDNGWTGPIVPEDYEYAVHDYDLHTPFTDQDCYQKQVDIYSDQIIAIEALRLEVLQLTQRITQAEWDYEQNAQDIMANRSKIRDNAQSCLSNKSSIDVLYQDVDDVKGCLSRQWDEQRVLRGVLELYCHQFTYVAHIPSQCQAILGAGSHIYQQYAWPSGENIGNDW